jgi:amino acid transporter
VDGLVWAELGAAMPRAGGTYAFLREAYGPGRGGHLMSFLYIWQTLIQAPLVVASRAMALSDQPLHVHGTPVHLLPVDRTDQRLLARGIFFAFAPSIPNFILF